MPTCRIHSKVKRNASSSLKPLHWASLSSPGHYCHHNAPLQPLGNLEKRREEERDTCTHWTSAPPASMWILCGWWHGILNAQLEHYTLWPRKTHAFSIHSCSGSLCIRWEIHAPPPHPRCQGLQGRWHKRGRKCVHRVWHSRSLHSGHHHQRAADVRLAELRQDSCQ